MEVEKREREKWKDATLLTWEMEEAAMTQASRGQNKQATDSPLQPPDIMKPK